MRALRFDGLTTVLCLGAHSDDIEIGAGATVLRLARENPSARFVWVVFAAAGHRGEEARSSAMRFLAGAGAADIRLLEHCDGYFPDRWAAIKADVEGLKDVAPDLVLTHYGKDRHQDHRTISELTWNTFRNHVVLEYEIPKYDADLGAPNVFAPTSIDDTNRKIAILLECFASQRAKHWFDDLTFRGLMRLRGLECCASSGFAEAFYGRKLQIG